MNIQTEHLENHTTRLTVQVETERVDKALREAARRISRKARIKGFRPGKAPYDVILNLYGREYVLGEALESLGNEIYREALDEAELDPYAPGSLEDVNEDDGLTLKFVVPRRPSVDLGDYRSIRVDHVVEEVTDSMVEEALDQLREQQVVLEAVERPSELGDKLTMAHFEVVKLNETTEEDAEEDAAEDTDEAAEADTEADAETDIETDDEVADEDVLIHQHGYELILTDESERDLFPGFSAELVGVNVGDEVEFDLEIPADYDMEDIAGATLHIEAHVEKIESRTVPEWTDELAKTITDGEHETLLDLRVDVRNKLEEGAIKQAEQRTAEAALDLLVEDATIQFPEELVDDNVTEILNELDMNLRQQGIGLEDFLRITGREESDLRAQYRDRAIERAKRSLCLSELVEVEELVTGEDDIDAEINNMLNSLGGNQTDQLMQFLNSEQNRMNIANRIATDRVVARLVAIARGEDPAKGPAPVAEAVEESNESAADTEPEVADAAADDTAADDTAATADEAAPEAEANSETEQSE